MYIDY